MNGRTAERVLRVTGVIELVTLALMLLNITTVHHPVVSSALGPVHGLAYTATVICAIFAARGRHLVWVLSLIPGVGGLLASYAARRIPVSAESESTDPWA